MNITEITNRTRAHRRRRRVGRGEGSGLGKTSGKGHKGHKARSDRVRGQGLSEGGTFPLFRRLPKFGFNNALFRREYQVVNVRDLEARFADKGHVTAATLFDAGLIRDPARPVKVLGDGNLAKKLTVEAERFSAEAERKITSVGGAIKKLGPQPKKKFVKRPPPPSAKTDSEGKKGKPSGDASEKASGAKKSKPEGDVAEKPREAGKSKPKGGAPEGTPEA